MKKDKILVIATTFPRWEKDTEATFVKDLCKEQSKEFEVHVLVPHYNGLKLKEKIDGLYMHRFIYFYPYKFQKLAYGGILPNLKKNPILILQAPFLFVSELINTIKILKKERIKVIHAHWFFPHGLISAICNKYLKVKSIVTIHAGGVIALNRIPLIKRYIADFIIKNNNIIISVSSFGKNLAIKMVSKKLKDTTKKNIKIIPMGIYTNNFKTKVKKNQLKGIKQKNTILFIGRLAEKKGVKYLIKALTYLKDSDYFLLIMGDGPLKDKIKKMIRKYNLENKVKFLGYLTGKEKIDYILASDIMVVPSIITKGGDTEGLPVTIIEGMASGLPIIATNVGGVKDILNNNKNGILINEKNPKQIAKKLNSLIKNKKLKEKISKNALLTSGEYDWRIIGKKNTKLIKTLQIKKPI